MTTTADPTRFERGLGILAQVDSHHAGQQRVNNLGDLGRYIVEFGFGDMYSRPGMSLREREIATVALLTALGGRESQLHYHMEAAVHVGITVQELEEIVLQTVPSAGFPTAINAMNILAQFKGEENLSEKESS